MRDAFNRFAVQASMMLGSPWAFGFALLLIVGWALMGPVFGFSDRWELLINTSTTIVTFLMVFLIQNTQNRDITSVQLKLDELIRSIDGARNHLICLEDIPDAEREKLKQEFTALKKDDGTAPSDAGTAPK